MQVFEQYISLVYALESIVHCCISFIAFYMLCASVLYTCIFMVCTCIQLSAELNKLAQPVPRDQFHGLPSTLEKRQQDFNNRQFKLDELSKQCFNHTDALVQQLDAFMMTVSESGHTVNYTNTVE